MGRTSYIRAWRRVTMLIETDVFLLLQTGNQSLVASYVARRQ